MLVIKSIMTEMEQFLSTESARTVPLCQRLNLLIKSHLSKHFIFVVMNVHLVLIVFRELTIR
jgi:hypothetical protein